MSSLSLCMFPGLDVLYYSHTKLLYRAAVYSESQLWQNITDRADTTTNLENVLSLKLEVVDRKAKCLREKFSINTTRPTLTRPKFPSQKWREMPHLRSDWWLPAIWGARRVESISTRWPQILLTYFTSMFLFRGSQIQCAKRRCRRHELSRSKDLQVNMITNSHRS